MITAGSNRRLSSWLLRCAFFFILSGALLSSVFSVRGRISLSAGETKDSFLARQGVYPLDFKLKLEDFSVTHYGAQTENEGNVKEFKSTIKIIDKGEELTKTIRVNHPLKYKGFTFLQSGYNPQQPNWTSFLVVKDPGVPLVFLGYFLLNLGFLHIFKKIKQK
jgi:cytochrome c biogenesis protein